ncbi:integrase core domain-containing protein [Chryseobacterium sp. Bi04]|uniref:integrase core domain-containing protein n=1 Tax=Chryseobacterium sp. Bi04 TaxID=2822345 RepID=UPI0033A9CD4A
MFSYGLQRINRNSLYQLEKSTQNSLIERLNKSCKTELLNIHVFKNLQDTEEKAN